MTLQIRAALTSRDLLEAITNPQVDPKTNMKTLLIIHTLTERQPTL